jgi:hypothetical protein
MSTTATPSRLPLAAPSSATLQSAVGILLESHRYDLLLSLGHTLFVLIAYPLVVFLTAKYPLDVTQHEPFTPLYQTLVLLLSIGYYCQRAVHHLQAAAPA